VSDRELREAERRWRESGGLEDRVRWWSERARAGELPAGTEALINAVSTGRVAAAAVELAAYLGDPRARALAIEDVVERVTYGRNERVLRVSFEEVGVDVQDVLSWIRELRTWDTEAFLRALGAAVRHLAAGVAARDVSGRVDPWITVEYLEEHRDRGLAIVEDGLRSIGRWIDTPEPALLDAVERTARVVGYGFNDVNPVIDATAAAACAVLATQGATPSMQWGRRLATYDVTEALQHWDRAVSDAAPDPVVLRSAVRDALVPWALRGVAD
jgi:hypothetical protein